MTGPSIPDYPIPFPIGAGLPVQTGNSGLFLTTDGTHPYWKAAGAAFAIGIAIGGATPNRILTSDGSSNVGQAVLNDFLPTQSGHANQFLKTDGAGNLSWGAAGGGGMAIGGAVSGGTQGSVLFVDGAGNLAQDNASLSWDDSNKVLFTGPALGMWSDISGNVAVADTKPNTLTSGTNNLYFGSGAFQSIDAGTHNLGIGEAVFVLLAGGSHCTGIGDNAGASLTSASDCVMVGSSTNGTATNNNQNCFGYQATSTGANQIVLGNGSITVIRAQVTSITALSDERDKSNIRDLEFGLDFIDLLRPVQGDWARRDGHQGGEKFAGFTAQDLQKIDNPYLKLVYSVDPDHLEATYGNLIPALVKANQELHAKVKALEAA